jgi:hypothetical protein
MASFWAFLENGEIDHFSPLRPTFTHFLKKRQPSKQKNPRNFHPLNQRNHSKEAAKIQTLHAARWA